MNATPITADMARAITPERPNDAHKGTFGHAIVIGGCRRYPGAPRLAAWGALRSGVGLVTMAVPTSIREIVSESIMESIIVELPETAVKPTLSQCTDKQAAVVGPGLSTQWDTREFTVALLRELTIPRIIDADALNAIAQENAQQVLAGSVITPHPGEMARLLGATTKDIQAGRLEFAANAAQQFDCVVVLKGFQTLIAAPSGDIHVNGTGNSGMATGGSGDVLAGLIGGLLAQGMDPVEAAKLGAFVHGLAGDFAAERVGARGMIARDIADAIPLAWQAIER